jgi:hypothetical protein
VLADHPSAGWAEPEATAEKGATAEEEDRTAEPAAAA